MGYRFDGFFVRTEEQAFIQELALSVKQQWPYVACRSVSEPFFGLGIRMTSFATDGTEEEVEQQDALKKELPAWSRRFPIVNCLYLSADCFGGVCIYEGYLCRNGVILFKEEDKDQKEEAGMLSLLRLLGQFGVTTETGYFKPFERGFFGPEKYFRPFEPEEDLGVYLSRDL